MHGQQSGVSRSISWQNASPECSSVTSKCMKIAKPFWVTDKTSLTTEESLNFCDVLQHLTLPVLLPHAKYYMNAGGHKVGESAANDKSI